MTQSYYMSSARKMQQKYILLQAELFQVNRAIEANLDRRTAAVNPEAVDKVLRKERDTVLRNMIGYKK